MACGVCIFACIRNILESLHKLYDNRACEFRTETAPKTKFVSNQWVHSPVTRSGNNHALPCCFQPSLLRCHCGRSTVNSQTSHLNGALRCIHWKTVITLFWLSTNPSRRGLLVYTTVTLLDGQTQDSTGSAGPLRCPSTYLWLEINAIGLAKVSRRYYFCLNSHSKHLPAMFRASRPKEAVRERQANPQQF